MKLEAALLKSFPQNWIGIGGGDESKIKSLTNFFIYYGVKGLVSFGFAGGLDPKLDRGSIIIAKSVLTPQGLEIPTSPMWSNRIAAQLHHAYSIGNILGSPHPITESQKKIELFHQTKAVAVDMESYAMAEIAQANQIPFIVIRVILDPAIKKIHSKIAALFQSDGKIKAKSIIKTILKEPQILKEFLILGRQFYGARRQLRYIARLFCPSFAFNDF